MIGSPCLRPLPFESPVSVPLIGCITAHSSVRASEAGSLHEHLEMSFAREVKVKAVCHPMRNIKQLEAYKAGQRDWLEHIGGRWFRERLV